MTQWPLLGPPKLLTSARSRIPKTINGEANASEKTHYGHCERGSAEVGQLPGKSKFPFEYMSLLGNFRLMLGYTLGRKVHS